MQIQTGPSRSLIDEVLRTTLVLGVALVLLIPAAREVHATVGWLPVWLVGMPASAWMGIRLATGRGLPGDGVRGRGRPLALARSSRAMEPNVRRRNRRVIRDDAQRVA